MKPLRILRRSLNNAIKSVFRNLSLSIASISCIVITLVLVAFSIMLSSNINNFTSDIEKDLTIVAFAKKNATSENIDQTRDELESIPNIKKINYKSKDKIKKEMIKDNEVFEAIMSEWDEDENPLQSSFVITVKNVDKIGETAKTLENLEYIDNVKYGEGMVEDLIGVFKIIKKITIIAVVALIFVTAFLISNTIKITIYSRKKEIDIMRLVGTSNTVIKLPFLFEGLFLGLLGSIVPILITIYGYVFFYEKMHGVIFTDIITLINPYNFVFMVSAVLVVIGVVVGMFSSARAVRKYLKI